MPLTPPLSKNDPEGTHILSRAVNVLSTAATALSQVTILYESDHVARDGLLQAVECVKRVHELGGKLIVCGVGKSGLVGQKMVATMKSLGLGSSFLHAAEALHGDLGDVRSVRVIDSAPLFPMQPANCLNAGRRSVVHIIFRENDRVAECARAYTGQHSNTCHYAAQEPRRVRPDAGKTGRDIAARADTRA